MFHRRCLQSFEKFMKNGLLTCPICRSTNYQKKLTRVGSQAYARSCAGHIQRLWRGYAARKRFQGSLRLFYLAGGGNGSRRKRFLESRLSRAAQRFSSQCGLHSDQLDHMISSMDRTVQENQQLNALFDQMVSQRSQQTSIDTPITSHGNNSLMTSPHGWRMTEQDWTEVIESARVRGPGDCPICMLPAPHGTTIKKNVILSCSHVFHEFCILNFEKFLGNTIPTCPVCRSDYEKRQL
mmetsp:Transcript_28486/g.40562  ORF Transcript_28486/g.40562 Transcript_28486/m.40562 type:complete len:238 (+) Transcript_28486:344-1057(+)